MLGAILLSRDALGAVIEQGLRYDDFYKPGHQHIYDAACAVSQSGGPADTITVADELERLGLLEQVGGVEALHSLQNATPAISNAGHYAQIVQDAAMLRRLIMVAGDISELAYSRPESVDEALDEAETKVFKVADRRVTDTYVEIGELMKGAIERIEENFARGDTITGVATGFSDLDELLSGLQPSTLNIVGARPAMGKCAAHFTPMVNLVSGEVISAAEMFELAATCDSLDLLSLDTDGRMRRRSVSACLDDGIKPVFKVTTRSGRTVTITACHPLLTARGWRPLADLLVGDLIAMPTSIPVFGSDDMPDGEIDLLALLIGDGALSGTTPVLISALDEVRQVAQAAAEAYGIGCRVARTRGLATDFVITGGARGSVANPVTEMLRRHELWGKTAHHKSFPRAIFRLPRHRLARFLNRLFATDGTAWVAKAGYARVGYCSMSEQLARDVQHALTRFGIRAKLRVRSVKYLEERRRAFEVEVMDAPSLLKFCDEVGILGKQDAIDRVRAVAAKAIHGYSLDTLPCEVWDDIQKARGDLSWAEVSRRCGRPSNHDWHPTRYGALRRETVAQLAEALDDDRLRWWASPDIGWDRVVSIEPAGEARVIDFTVPGTHNFVAADLFLHNTAFGLGMATNIAKTTNRPVLVFSLEMGHIELTQRILSSEAEVDSQKIRNGRLSESDWAKIGRAIGRLEVPLYLDDNPRVTVMEIRAKARRLKMQRGDLALIVIDYLQLMSGGGQAENRQLEVSEISRNLKILARELEVPIVALSQLSRNVESRSDKRPMLSDLRESGCLVASTRLLRADTNAEVTLGELVESGARDIPVWSLDERYRLVPSVLTHAFPSGVKPVFAMQLASGRSLEATGAHRFRTIDGWVSLEQLEVGSRIAVPRELAAPECVEAIDPDELVLIAHLLGDGCVLPRQPVHYTSADPANLDAVENAASRRFGITARRVQQENWWHSYLPAPYRLTHGRRNPVAGWWDGLGLHDCRSWDKFVPRVVFGLPRDQLAEFLRHLWATDGSLSFRRSGPSIGLYYASTSRRLVDGIQQLLLRFEIQSRISQVQQGEHRPGYRLRIDGVDRQRRFLTEIGIHGARGERVPRALELLSGVVAHPNVDTIPFAVRARIVGALRTAGMTHRELAAAIDEEYCASYLLGSESRPRTSSRRRLARMASVLEDKELAELAASDVLWDRVVSIEPVGEQPVFDATVLATHNFIANGIVAHNSLEQDSDVVMFLYRDEVYNKESTERGAADVIIAKHRAGPIGDIRLVFRGQYARFDNAAPRSVGP